MTTRLRVDLAGYHHVINRGLNRCDVFNHSNDKDMFLQIVNYETNQCNYAQYFNRKYKRSGIFGKIDINQNI